MARRGKDRDVDKSAAFLIGLRTKTGVPMRTVELEAAQSPDGRARALSLVYNSDGKTMKPVAFVLWRIDVSSSLPAGTYTEGRTFLARLNGRLARAVKVTQEPREDGKPYQATALIPSDSPAAAHGLHKEFDFWFAESAKPGALLKIH